MGHKLGKLRDSGASRLFLFDLALMCKTIREFWVNRLQAMDYAAVDVQTSKAFTSRTSQQTSQA
jgi:hypothetical protein